MNQMRTNTGAKTLCRKYKNLDKLGRMSKLAVFFSLLKF